MDGGSIQCSLAVADYGVRIRRKVDSFQNRSVQQYAVYLEQNREPFLCIREKWIQTFHNDEKMMEEADTMSFMEMHRKIQAIVEEDLVALKWNCNV